MGFDQNEYPGDNLLPALRRSFSYTGYWLNNPPGAKSNGWVGKRATLKALGFGFMLLRITVSARLRAENTLEHADHALQLKHWGSIAIYLISVPLATHYPRITLGLICALTLLWVIPTLGVEKCDAPPHSHSR